jgi:hypothetical protein
MENYEKILVLGNAFEAERMEELLRAKNIPYAVIQTEDSVLGGIMNLEKGWGYLEAPLNFKKEILALYEEKVKKTEEE